MNIKSSIAQLAEVLNSVSDQDAVYAEADAMYNASFIAGLPFLISELHSSEVRQLQKASREIIANSKGLIKPEVCFTSYKCVSGEQTNDDGDYDYDYENDDVDYEKNEYELDAYYDALESIELPILADTTMVIALVNYKGEGEGYALYESVKHYPIFTSKSNSFDQFGS